MNKRIQKKQDKKLIKHLKRVNLSKEDTLVATINKNTKRSEIEYIYEYLKNAFPNNEVVVFANGMTLGILHDEINK